MNRNAILNGGTHGGKQGQHKGDSILIKEDYLIWEKAPSNI